MPLSDEERRRLEELENLLSAQDPSLARNLEAGKPAGPVPRRMILAILAVLAGLVLVVVGVSTQILLIGIAGFALECVAAYWLLDGLRISSWKVEPPARSRAGKGKDTR
jgi:hypothetical protein